METYETTELNESELAEVESIRKLMNEEKTKLQSLRNQEWKKLKTETEKVNKLLPYIPTEIITDLNNFIYAGAKTLSMEFKEKKTEKEKGLTKSGWELRLQIQEGPTNEISK